VRTSHLIGYKITLKQSTRHKNCSEIQYTTNSFTQKVNSYISGRRIIDYYKVSSPVSVIRDSSKVREDTEN
jgi:hypothetical protein